MKSTKHAQLRMQQRGFSNLSIDVICRFGRKERAPGGAMRIVLGRREHQMVVSELKKMIQMLDKAKGGKIVVFDDQILTVFK